MDAIREEAHEHPKWYISLPLPPLSTPPSVAGRKGFSLMVGDRQRTVRTVRSYCYKGSGGATNNTVSVD